MHTDPFFDKDCKLKLRLSRYVGVPMQYIWNYTHVIPCNIQYPGQHWIASRATWEPALDSGSEIGFKVSSSLKLARRRIQTSGLRFGLQLFKPVQTCSDLTSLKLLRSSDFASGIQEGELEIAWRRRDAQQETNCSFGKIEPLVSCFFGTTVGTVASETQNCTFQCFQLLASAFHVVSLDWHMIAQHCMHIPPVVSNVKLWWKDWKLFQRRAEVSLDD